MPFPSSSWNEKSSPKASGWFNTQIIIILLLLLLQLLLLLVLVLLLLVSLLLLFSYSNIVNINSYTQYVLYNTS